jgi:hypothetical protein
VWPLGPDVHLQARLQVQLGKVDRLECAEADGKDVEAQLDRAREQVLVLQHTIRIQAEAEAELWAQLWATPQAVQWERLRWIRDVAQYTRWKVLGEAGDLKSSQEARQLGDRLGLTPLAMLRLRWQVVADEVGEQRQTKKTTARKTPARRPRLKAVDPGT